MVFEEKSRMKKTGVADREGWQRERKKNDSNNNGEQRRNIHERNKTKKKE